MSSHENEEGSYASTLLVFLLGVAVGATVAILYAPMTGQETRTQIADKAGKLRDRATEIKDQVVEKASQLRERFQGAAKAPEIAESEVPDAGNGARG
jgi:gas vesicle protein